MRSVISANMAHVVFFGVLACAVAVIGVLDSGSTQRVNLAALPSVQGVETQ